ncbi:cytochrome-c peroxidase [Vibrio sagamiensis]|nr:cytochrome c peroxidase [Vibrio sagamiensis]PNQ62612.1 cytochrome-c peroxidase [Vibrio agarivorans]
MKIRLTLLVLMLVLVLLLVVINRYPVSPKVTVLDDFSAPFVFGHFTVPKDNPLTNEGVKLGRRLFYDPILSGSNQISCAHCHQQSRAFTDGMVRSLGASGMPLPFNTPTLANLMWGPQHFFWDGRSPSLEQQALLPITNPDEMNQDLDELMTELKRIEEYRQLFSQAYGEINQQNIAKALSAFQRTLVSANSKYDQFLAGTVILSAEEELGRKLFMAHPDVKASLRGGNCIDCHSQFLTGGFDTQYDGFSNNGLDEEQHLLPGLMAVTGKAEHKGLFKVPTLRNIALTAPYMHDGRFQSLEEVLDHYNQGIKLSSTLSPLIVEADNQQQTLDYQPSLNLSEKEKQAIIAFLHTLTDESFITDPKLSNPFIEEVQP